MQGKFTSLVARLDGMTAVPQTAFDPPTGPHEVLPASPLSNCKSEGRLSMDRTTEQEGIIVDEGYCELSDPSFGNAASRLACLELEDLGSPSHSGISSLADSRGSSSKSLQAKLAAPQGNLSQSLKAPKNASKPMKATSSASELSSQASLGTSNEPSSRGVPVERVLTARSSSSIPPGSPFSHLEFQTSSFPAMTKEEAASRLDTATVNNRLISGLKSLSADELSVYMQLTDELRSEGVGQPNSADQKFSDPLEPLSSCSSKEDEERLETAIRKLKSLLPPEAIEQLQSHNSYGLMDILNSQPPRAPADDSRV